MEFPAPHFYKFLYEATRRIQPKFQLVKVRGVNSQVKHISPFIKKSALVYLNVTDC